MVDLRYLYIDIFFYKKSFFGCLKIEKIYHYIHRIIMKGEKYDR